MLCAGRADTGGTVCVGAARADTSRGVCCHAAGSTGTARTVGGSAASSTGASSGVFLGEKSRLAAGSTGTAGAVSTDTSTAEAIGSVCSLTAGTCTTSRMACGQSGCLSSYRSASEGRRCKPTHTNGHAGHGDQVQLGLLLEGKRERRKMSKS